MPFVSEKQRKLFWAARKSKRLRKRLGLSEEDVRKMTEHDEGGKLPVVSEATKKALHKRKRKS